MDVQTIGFQGISDREDMVRFAVFCSLYNSLRVPETITKADFFVGRPSAPDIKPCMEDDGRTDGVAGPAGFSRSLRLYQ